MEKQRYKIVDIHPENDVYQIVDTEDNSVLMQSSKKDCEDYLFINLLFCVIENQ